MSVSHTRGRLEWACLCVVSIGTDIAEWLSYEEAIKHYAAKKGRKTVIIE